MPEKKKKEALPDIEEGLWYLKLCKKVNKWFGPKQAALEKRQKKLQKFYERKYRELKLAENNLSTAEYIYTKDDPRYSQALKKYEKAKREFDNAAKVYKQAEFKKMVYFAGIDVEYHEVEFLSIFMTMLLFIIMMIIAMVIYVLIPIDITMYLIYMILPTAFLPMFMFVFLFNYPKILSNRLKVRMLGRAPEAVNYMVMSMSLTPALDKAVAFAAENTDEPLASGLKKVIWNIYTRKFNTIEDSFLDFAYEWGYWNEDLKRALYAIRMAVFERSEEGLKRNLEKAKDIVLLGTKKKIDEFAASLSGPTTILFAIGILMPMVIGAMLPMISLVNINLTIPTEGSSAAAGITGAQQASDNTVTLVVLMDILFPVITFGYAYYILGRRPGTTPPPNVKSKLSQKKKNAIFITSIILAVGISLISIPMVLAPEGTIYYYIGPLPIIVGIGLGIAYYCGTTVFAVKKERDDIMKMEEEFPDALFQLGSRMAEGSSVEVALKRTAESMEGTKIGELLKKIVFSIQVSGETLDEVLFSRTRGILKDFPSKLIAVTFKTITEIVKKDPLTAGQTIIEIANYQRDLKKVDHEIRRELASTAGMMKTTAIVFAPIVMGMTSALYVLLSKTLIAITQSQLISIHVFYLILGIYLILTDLIIIYFVTGVEHGEDWSERKAMAATTLPIAVLIYAVTTVMGQLAIGV
ncbi:MAG: hypothetical protein N3F63_03340 [Thermoplasmata archaeon]|nr:hypothetical protein [Thermoplasmata archaeon]